MALRGRFALSLKRDKSELSLPFELHRMPLLGLGFLSGILPKENILSLR
jgi:hypothetical protein